MASSEQDPNQPYQKSYTKTRKNKQWQDIAGLSEKIKIKLMERGWELPTKIQYDVLPEILNGNTEVPGYFVKALNGSGKTGTFIIPALQFVSRTKDVLIEVKEEDLQNKKEKKEQKQENKIIFDDKQYQYYPQCIIIVDTGVMVDQLADDLQSIIPDQWVDKVRVSRLMAEIVLTKKEDFGHVLITTPGLLNRLISVKKIRLEGLKFLAIDECEEIWNKFQQDVIKLIHKVKVNEDLRIMACSATLNDEFKKQFAYKFEKKFMGIESNKNLTLEGIIQYYFQLGENDPEPVKEILVEKEEEKKEGEGEENKEEEKNEEEQTTITFIKNETNDKEAGKFVVEIIKKIKAEKLDTQILVFVNTKESVKTFHDVVMESDLKEFLRMTYINGNIPCQQRRQIMTDFRKGAYDILFTTNLLARGIDVRTVGLVINAEAPRVSMGRDLDHVTYLHRIARTGRYNDIGVAITLFKSFNAGYNNQDKELVEMVKKEYKQKLSQYPGLDGLCNDIKKALVNNSRLDNMKQNVEQ